MFTELLKWQDLFVSIGLIAGAFVVGIIVERLILTRLKKITARTSWKGDDIIIAAIRGKAILWFCLAGIYGALLTLPLTPSVNNILQKILFIIIILSVSLVLGNIAAGLMHIHSKKTEALPSASLFVNLTRILILIIGALIILQGLGISITPLITALGVGGLAVALALQPTLSNFFAGLQVIISKQVEVGDYVELDSGQRGYVTDISWRNTTIRQISNNLIVVPNAKLADAIVTNFNQPQKEMSVIVEVGVSYASDLDKVEQVTLDVARRALKDIEGGQEKFEPFMRYHTFGDSSINFSVYLRVHEFVNQYLVKHEFIKALHKRYNQEGINIPFPIRTLYVKK
ncbi:MAG: mechanosensitive ion channel family protein [candidate division WOR-3 bacterium]|nr:MAG: mechanosensitive ion channel family protein [candidate division WOR-3 bacterium]